jgi:iron(III) transport system substrate-binding protein
MNAKTLAVLVLMLGTAASVARAQNDAADQGLAERARQEGSVALYSISPTPVVQAIADRFTKKYGIKVDIFRAGGAQIEQKLYLEMRSGRVAADVIELGDATAVDQIAARGGIADYTPTNAAGLAPALIGAHGDWVTIAQHVYPIIYNNQKLTPAEAPQTYAALADPKWKDKLVVASPNYGSTQTILVEGLVELEGWGFVQKLKANNVMVARGFPDLENAIATGERLAGIDISIRLVQALQQGAPLGAVFPADGTIAVQDVVAVLKAAPHPNAARLLEEFLLSDELQRFLRTAGMFPVKPSAGSPGQLPPLASLKLHYVNLDELEAQRREMVSRWTDLVER